MSRGLQQPKVLLLTEPGENQQEFVRQFEEHCTVEIATSPDITDRADLIFVTYAALEKFTQPLSEFQAINRFSSPATKQTVIGVSEAQYTLNMISHVGLEIDDFLPLPVQPNLLKSRLSLWFELSQLRYAKLHYQEYTAMFVNDIRSPISAVISGLDLVINNSELLQENERREVLTISFDYANRLVRLTEAFLEFASVTQALEVNRYKSTPVKPLIEEVLSFIEPEVHKMQKQISVTIPSDLLSIQCIDFLLKKAMGCLFNNLWQNTVSGGIILIEVEQVLDRWNQSDTQVLHIAIKDIVKDSPSNQSNLPFGVSYERRIHKDRHYDLNLVRFIIEHHGGRIWIESVQDQEIAFHLTLPVLKE